VTGSVRGRATVKHSVKHVRRSMSSAAAAMLAAEIEMSR
jgi:hypothetical protein